MTIIIAADHRGWQLKEEIKKWLSESGHEVIDKGADSYDPDDDYPDYALGAAKSIAAGDSQQGILICGSGAGMAIAANKVAGIRAAVVHSPAMAEAAKKDDWLNVLVLGADYTDLEQAQAIVSAWLTTSHSDEPRHERRLAKIAAYEESAR